VNWFGVKLGAGAASAILGADGKDTADTAAGVGKYLNLKRPREEPVVSAVGGAQEAKKRKKVGFGDFQGW